jgi:hypothetical protein
MSDGSLKNVIRTLEYAGHRAAICRGPGNAMSVHRFKGDDWLGSKVFNRNPFSSAWGHRMVVERYAEQFVFGVLEGDEQ